MKGEKDKWVHCRIKPEYSISEEDNCIHPLYLTTGGGEHRVLVRYGPERLKSLL
jgi:hypothetical protein